MLPTVSGLTENPLALAPDRNALHDKTDPIIPIEYQENTKIIPIRVFPLMFNQVRILFGMNEIDHF